MCIDNSHQPFAVGLDKNYNSYGWDGMCYSYVSMGFYISIYFLYIVCLGCWEVFVSSCKIWSMNTSKMVSCPCQVWTVVEHFPRHVKHACELNWTKVIHIPINLGCLHESFFSTLLYERVHVRLILLNSCSFWSFHQQ